MPDYDDKIVRPSIPQWRFRAVPAAISFLVLLIVVIGLVFWFVIRVEVDANEILVLVNKTGKTIPAELVDEFGDQVVLYPELVLAIVAFTNKPLSCGVSGFGSRVSAHTPYPRPQTPINSLIPNFE